MMHHENGTLLCPRCEEKLKQAHPKIVEWFRLIKSNFKQVHIAHSFRGKEDQDMMFSSGASALKFPYSPHNRMDEKMNPQSWALDLFEQTNQGKGIWPVKLYNEIWVFSQTNKLPIYWGGCFQHQMRGDFNHFELCFK